MHPKITRAGFVALTVSVAACSEVEKCNTGYHYADPTHTLCVVNGFDAGDVPLGNDGTANGDVSADATLDAGADATLDAGIDVAGDTVMDTAMDGGTGDAAIDGSADVDACMTTDLLGDGVDSNCDGVDGVLGTLVFVSGSGVVIGDGGAGVGVGTTTAHPVATLAEAFALMATNPRLTGIEMQGGTYTVPVTMLATGGLQTGVNIPAGVTIAGGYDASWLHNSTPTQINTQITGLVVQSAHNIRVANVGISVSQPTDGTNVYGAVVVNGDLSLDAVHIVVANGGAGAPGTSGTNGGMGGSGGMGSGSAPGSGGFSTCVTPAGGGAGGAGGTGTLSTNSPGSPGMSGTGAPGGGGGNTSTPPVTGNTSGNGTSGIVLTTGGGLGSYQRPTSTQDFYEPVAGATGTDGSDGLGGGGGGGGGIPLTMTGTGGGGGGGGAGGCRGTGGTGGGGGYASIGLVVQGDVTCVITLEHGSVVQAGNGGVGGGGGPGGSGGTPGTGGSGGGPTPGGLTGASGGNGGAGGSGAGGAGGAGGPSVGALNFLPATINVNADSRVMPGLGGTGGAGGAQPGGTASANGAVGSADAMHTES